MEKSRSEGFFSEEENARIRTVIEAAESGTSGEIVAMVAERSDSYREAEVLGAVLTSALGAFLVEIALQFVPQWISSSDWGAGFRPEMQFILHGVSLWTYIPFAFLLFFPIRYLFRRHERLKLAFTGRRRISEAVRERAIRAFFEKGLYRTRDETGILIFISLLERKVWILGDRGINSRIPAEEWRDLARELTAGLGENRACESLCSVIAACGKELSRHFPKKPDDTNELTDEVLQ